MTTKRENSWAAILEESCQSEILSMAKYAIDHIESMADAENLRSYIDEAVFGLDPVNIDHVEAKKWVS